MSDRTLTGDAALDLDAEGEVVTGLVIAGSTGQPRRVGEIALFGDGGPRRILGRGGVAPDDDAARVGFGPQRPGSYELGPPLEGPGLSRRQLTIEPGDGELHVRRIGRCALLVDGREVEEAVVRPGSTVHLRGQLLLLCVRRPAELPPVSEFPATSIGPFGEADRHGIVGESPAVWELRERLAFVARRAAHVLVRGQSGAGKELAASAIHALSSRAGRPLVARNAATIPAGLVDAELFGHVADYPNPGMKERLGLVGEAHQSTLFLDEIGELPEEQQAHLLRVLDSGGEYQRLGEARPRRVDLRLIAATNRPEEALKHDLLARLPIRLELPSLNDRREDIPLIARHVLLRTAEKDPDVAARFFEDVDGRREPRIDLSLMDLLVRHAYTHHARELGGLLLQAMVAGRDGTIRATPEVARRLRPVEAAIYRDPQELTSEEIQACLDRNGGNQSRAYRELGLKNRDVLYRLMKKHGLAARS